MIKLKHLLLLLIFALPYWILGQCQANAGPDTSICIGSSAQIGAIPAATGAAPISYSWSPAIDLSCTTCPNPIVTPTANRFYTLTITDNNGCTDTDVIHVTRDPLPNAAFSIVNNNSCASIPIQFQNNSSGSGLTYLWNFNDPSSGAQNSSTQANPTHLFQAFGSGNQTFSVSLTVTNAAGCSATITHNVTVSASPNAALIDPITSFKNCGGGTYTLTAYDGSATTNVSNYTINWGDGLANFSSSSFPGSGVNHTYSTSEVFTLTYIVTGTNGCSDTALYNVANITNPAIGAANPGGTTGCGPVTLCFPLSNYSSNHITTFYVVDYGDGSPTDTLPHPPPLSVCHTYTSTSCGQPGNQFVFRIKAINLCDSSEATVSPIRVYLAPVANFTPAVANGCVNSTITFLNQTIPGSNSSCSGSTLFQWNFGNGQTLTTTALTNPTTTYSSPGTYTVTLSTSNSCGTQTITKTVCIEAPPTPQFTLTPSSSCVPFTTSISNTSVLTNTCNVTRTWSVLFNGSPCAPATGSFAFVGGTNATSVNPQILFNTPGNYTVRLTLTNSCGSFIYDQNVVAQTLPVVSINPIAAICAATSINPSAVVNSCLEPADSYSWTFTGGTPASSTSLSPGSISYATGGTYPVTFSATNACGTTPTTINVVVNSIPPALNPVVNSPLCVGSTANFSSTVIGGVNYSWTGPGGFTSTASSFNLTNVQTTQAGIYSVVGSIGGCLGPSSSVNLVVNPLPVVTVTPTPTSICLGNSVTLTASGASTYTWSPATGLSATTGSSVSAAPTSTTTYTIVGNNGTCSNSTTAIVTVNPLPVVNAGADQTVCNQPIPVTLVGTPAGGIWSGTSVTAGGIFTPNGTGVFPLVYSFTNANGCINTDTMFMTVVAPAVPNAGLDTSVCLNSGNVAFVGTPVGGTWTGSFTTSGGVFTPSTVGTYPLVYSFGTATCLVRDTVLMTVLPLPIIAVTPNPTSICLGNSVTLTASGATTYTWSPAAGLSATNGSSVVATPTSTTVYTIVGNNGTCSNSTTATVTVNPLPVVNAGVNQTVCNQPIPVTLVGTPAGGTWSGTSVTAGGIFTPNGTGTFPLVYSFTNANGCTNTDTMLMTVVAPAVPNAGLDTSICLNSGNVTFGGTPAGGTWTGSFTTSGGVFTPSTVGTYALVYTVGTATCLVRDTVLVTVINLPIVNAGSDSSLCIDAGTINLFGTPTGGIWSGTGIINPTGIFDPAISGAGTFTLTYTFTNSTTTCSATDTKLLTVYPLPVVNAGIDTIVCNSITNVHLNGFPAGGTWSGAGISSTGDFVPSTNGTFTFTYSFTNANGCTQFDSRIVTVNSPVTPNAGTDQTACIDAPNITLSGTPSGGIWTGTDVSAGGVFNPTTAGTFPLIYTYGAGLCLQTDTLLMIVNPLPIVNAGLDQSSCVNASNTTLVGSPSGGTWTGTGVSAGGIFNPSTAGVGTFTLTYTYTHPTTNCTNSDQLIMTVLAIPVVNAGIDSTVCNQPISFQLIGSPSGGTWSGSSITPSGQYTPSGTGIFTVTYSFTNANGCTNTDSRDITVINPTIPVAGIDQNVCIDAPNITLTASPSGGIWTGTDVSSGGIFNPTTAGTFDLVYSYGAGACLQRDTLLMTVNPLPIVNAGPDQSSCVNAANTTLVGSPSGGTWTGTGVSAGGIFNPSTAGVGTFTLTYTYTHPTTNCTNSDQLIMTVLAIPVVNAGIDSTVCNQPISFQLIGTPSGGTWSGSSITPTGQFTPSGTGIFTVTYSFTNAAGCTNTDSRDITVISVTPSNAGLDLAACVGDNPIQLVSQPSFGVWTGTNVSSTGLFSPITVGTFPLVISNGAGNCLQQDTMLFTVHPLPTIDLGTNLAFCPTDTIHQLFANPSGGVWSGVGITNGSTPTFNPSIPSPGTYTLNYTYTESLTGCINEDSISVIIHPQPIASFTFDSIICIGNQAVYSNTSNITSAEFWDFGNGLTANTFDGQTSYGTVGFYTITLIETSIFGCSDTISNTIEVQEPPMANFTALPDSACGPITVDFTNLSTGQDLIYDWNFGNGQSSSAFSPTAQIYPAGILTDSIFTVTLTASNACGISVHQDTIQTMPIPIAIFGIISDVGCSPFLADFVDNSFGLPDTFSWDFGDGTSSPNSSPTMQHTFVTGLEDTTYTIQLIVSNECGSDTISHTITVLPNDVNPFFNTNAPSGCAPHTVQFTQFSQGASFSSWDFGDGNTSTVYSPSHTFTQPGTYVVQLFANNTCSYDTTETTITVYPTPQMDFSVSPDSVCVGVPFTFTNLSSGIAGVTWDFGDGDTSNLISPTHQYGTNGTYTVTLSGESLTYGCTAQISQQVTVSLQPTALMSATPINGCAPLPVQFQNSSINSSFQTWDFGDGNTTGLSSPQHTYTQPGIYSVQFIAENSNGCTDTAQLAIHVYDWPVADFEITALDSCTVPTMAQFSNTSSGAVSYTWNFSDGGSSTLNDPSHTYSSFGTFDIELIAINQYGCSDTTQLSIHTYEPPTAIGTISTDSICENGLVTFNENSLLSTSIEWLLGNGTNSNLSSFDYAYSTSGNYTIQLVATGNGGCTDTLTFGNPLFVAPNPTADFSYENILSEPPGYGEVAFTNLSSLANSYTWNFGNGHSSTEENPHEMYNDWGDFDVVLIAMNEYGCIDSIRQTITVDFYYGLYIPNAFSPGHSEFEVANFIPKGVGLKSFELLIYDDWGNLIWSTHALDEDGRPTEYWDGTYLGQPVQQDAYVWKASAVFLNDQVWEGKKYPNGLLKPAGTVTVIR